MGMRPIDVQISIPRSAEVGRVAQGDQQQNQIRQQEVLQQSQVHTDNYEKTVRRSEEAEAKKVKEEKEKEKKKQQQMKKQDSQDDSQSDGDKVVSNPSKMSSKKTSGLDIIA